MPQEERIEWDKAKVEYVTTEITIPEIAEKYHSTLQNVRRVCSKEGWVPRRKEYRRKIAERALASQEEKDVHTLTSLLESVDTLANRLADIDADDMQFNRRVVLESLGNGITKAREMPTDSVDMKAMRDYAETVKTSVMLARNLYKMPSLTEQAKMAADLAKVKEADDAQNNAGVVQIAEVLPVHATEKYDVAENPEVSDTDD